MNFFKKILFFISVFAFASCSTNSEDKTATVNIESKSGSNVTGKVIFTQTGNLVQMKAEVFGLKEGNHAFHIHAIGDCTAEDGKSAGGHWNPTNSNHGKWNVGSYHTGDIGNIVADANGKGTIERKTNNWCINCDDDAKNIVGKAIIIHAGPDDFSSQPSGAAGPRVGCGEIKVK